MDPVSPKSGRKGGRSKESKVEVEQAPIAESSDVGKAKERSRSKSPKSRRNLVESAVASSSNESNVCDWETLPMEVCLRIMEGLFDDLESLLALGKVSVFWRTVSTSEETWRSLFHRTFFKLEPHDEYFLEHGAPKPTLLKEVRTTTGALPLGPSSFYSLFAFKYPLHKRWMDRQFTTALIRPANLGEKFSMMVPWKGFCVTAGSDGRICIWDPKNFASSVSSASSSSSKPHTSEKKDKSKLKPWRTLNAHDSHIWWMTIQGDLCFTVGSDGAFKVTNFAPLAGDQNAELEMVVVTSSDIPIWAIDVHRRSRRVVIGAQDGTITLLYWKKGNWKQWKAIRTVKVRSGIWDVCLLPGRRFAVCCNIDVSIFNFEPSETERSLDEENPPQIPQGALVGINRRADSSPLDAKLPPEGAVIENRSRAGITRNLNFIDGLLITACSTVGLEAWDLNSQERVWTLNTRGYDIFDVGMTNNKLVCVGTDDRTGYAAVLVYDGRTREFLFETGPDSSIGRVFSTCITDESIYVCAVDSLYHVSFKPPSKATKDDSSCTIS